MRLRPESPEAQYHLGLALARKNDREGAVAAFRKTLELDPAHAEAKANLDRLAVAGGPQLEVFESYIRDKRFKEVEPLLAGYVKEHPDSWWGWYALGYAQFAQQKVGDSIKSLAKSLQLNIKSADAHKVLGRDMMLIGRFDAAQIEFEQAARLDPKSAEVRFNLGKLFSIQDNWAAAKRELDAALRLDPAYVEAYDALGFALESLGDDAGAVANYEKAIRLNEERKGSFSAAYVNLSALRNREGNTDAALENARKALQLNPKSDRGLFQMAKAYEQRGELNGAMESLSRAISLNSHASSYYYVLGTILRRLGRSKESQEAFESFRKLEKDSSEIDRKRRELAKEDPVRFGAQPDGGGR